MTVRKDLKRLIRARMAKTGESYTSARRNFLSSKGNKLMTEINESIPQYFSSDLDNNISFYTELLGAEVLYHHRENDRLMWVMVQLGASKLGFEQLDGDRPTPHDLKTVEISFYCDDLEGLWEKLMDANVEPSEIEPTFGMDRFVARDRDGYTLVFWRATILEQPKQSTISAFGH